MFIQSRLGGFVGGELSVWDDLKLIGMLDTEMRHMQEKGKELQN